MTPRFLGAHLYGLTEPEFTRLLSTFPLVPEPGKGAKAFALVAAALAAFRSPPKTTAD